MKIGNFHVQAFFCSMIQIKLKKVKKYLRAIYVFAYICNSQKYFV